MNANNEERIEIKARDARQAQTGTGMRYVLMGSLALAALAGVVLMVMFG